MSKKEPSKELHSVNVSFKIKPSQFEPYKKIIEETGIKKGTLCRDVFISKSEKIEVAAPVGTDVKRLTFLASQASNNINQIARKLNEGYRSGIVNESLFVAALNKLVTIEQSYIEAMKKC